MSRLKARRKAIRRQEIQEQVEKKTYSWKDVGKLVYTYGKRTKYRKHVGSWSKEDLDKWKADRKYKGQTKSNPYRLFKRALRDLNRKAEALIKKKEMEKEIDRDEDIFDAAENRDEQQREDTKERNNQ